MTGPNLDFEQRLQALLTLSVDDQLGARRPAPPFDARRPVIIHTDHRRRRRNLLPLAAAACVAACAALIGVLVSSQGRTPTLHRHSTPPMHSSVPAPPPPATSGAPTPTPQRSTASSSRPAPPSSQLHPVQLSGATVLLPAGWVARNEQAYESAGSSRLFPTWCLTPSSVPVTQGAQDSKCPVYFSLADPDSSQSIDVNTQGGYASNPAYCEQSSQIRDEHDDGGPRQLDGRDAEWRLWRFSCATGPTYWIEQYVIPTAPTYLLYSAQPDDRYHAALTQIAQHLQLPAQTRPLRLNDYGYLRSTRRVSGGYRIELERVITGAGPTRIEQHQLVSYLVPTALYDQAASAASIRRGGLVVVYTNGRQVVSFIS